MKDKKECIHGGNVHKCLTCNWETISKIIKYGNLIELMEYCQERDKNLVKKVENFRSGLEGIEEMVSLDSILYKLDFFLEQIK